MVLVTGAAGFIGSNFVIDWLAQSDEPVINLDALTYAGNLENLASLQGDARHTFVHGDIGDFGLVSRLPAEHQHGRVRFGRFGLCVAPHGFAPLICLFPACPWPMRRAWARVPGHPFAAHQGVAGRYGQRQIGAGGRGQ